jgi:hypothetical protein
MKYKILFFLAGVFLYLGLHFPFVSALGPPIYFSNFEMYLYEFFLFLGFIHFLLAFWSKKWLFFIHIFFTIVTNLWIWSYLYDIWILEGNILLGGYAFLVSFLLNIIGSILFILNRK